MNMASVIESLFFGQGFSAGETLYSPPRRMV